MADRVKEKTKAKSKQFENQFSQLFQKAMRAKAGYDYPAALNLFEQAQIVLDKLAKANGVSEVVLLEKQFSIHDGRAVCYNWMAESNYELDELKGMVKLATQLGEQSRRINAINRQAEALFGLGDFEKGERLCLQARDLAIENGDKHEQGQSLWLLSQALFQKGEIENSSHSIERALAIFTEIEDFTGQSKCLTNMAFNGIRTGHTKDIQEYSEQALQAARQANDHQSEANSLNVMGIISNDVSRTRDYYKQALQIFTTIGDVGGQNRIANNLGLLFWRLGLYGQANYYANQAVRVSRERGNKRALAVCLDGVGRSWLELGDLDQAEMAFQEGLELSKEYADAFDVAACLMGLARVAYERGNDQAAIDYFQDQVELLRGKGDVPEIAVVLAWIGAAHFRMGNFLEAERTTSEAVAHLMATDPNTDLLDQEVWWSRYQVLKGQSLSDKKARGTNDDDNQARLMLDRARASMMGYIEAVSDEGLRRNYLTKVPVNREITQEWTRQFHNRPEFKGFIQPKVITGNLQEQFKRLSDIGTRLSTQRDPEKLPDFIMNEVVELNGAERAFLATINEGGELAIVNPQGLSKIQAEQIVKEREELFDHAVETRYAVIKEIVGEIPEGEVAEMYQRSVLVVPLVSQSQVLGVIYTDLRRIFGSFNQNDVDLLTVLANQAAAALESANWTRTLEVRVEERTAELEVANSLLEEQNADLAVINEIQQGLAAKLDFQEIIELVGDRLITIFPEDELAIMLYEAETNLCYWAYTHYQGRRFQIDPTPPKGFTGHIIKTSKTIVVNKDLERTAKKFGSELLSDVDMPKSIAYVPIITEGKVTGVVGLSNIEKENAFDEASVRLVESLTASLGIALSNVRLFDETNQRAAELAIINSVQDGLAEELDIPSIFELVGEKIREIFDAQVVLISTFDHETKMRAFPYLYEKGRQFHEEPIPFNELSHKLISNRKPIVINEDMKVRAKELGLEISSGTEPVKSLVFVPMIIGDSVMGSVSLQNIDRENAYPESAVRLLITLTSSMSVALENARLFDETNRLLDETQQRNAELTILNSVGDAMAQKQDVDTITQIVGDKVRDIFKADIVEILLYDSQNQIITIPYHQLDRGGKDILSFQYGEGLTSIVIETRQPLLFGTAEESNKSGAISVANAQDENKTESYIGVPIIIGERVLGVVSVQSYRKYAYDDSSVRLLSTLAASMGVAIENARLFEEINQRAAELVVINSVQEGLAAELDMQTIYDLVGDKIRDVFDANGVGISIYDHDRDMVNAAYVYELGERLTINPFPINISNKKFIEKRKPMMFNTPDEYDAFGAKMVEGTKQDQSGMWVPLMVGDVVKGRINVYNLEEEYAFDDADLRLLATVASSMSVSLENARLFDETNQRAAELAIINSVGEAMAKQLDVDTISISRFTIAVQAILKEYMPTIKGILRIHLKFPSVKG
jgi:GAF domain-containing protein/tetratricopeptide (TPR) repeat protein